MTLRVFVELPLAAGAEIELPPGPARHVQVRRLQPGDALVLFDGRGGEWHARVRRIGRAQVTVGVDAHAAVDREVVPAITLAVGMPAGDRMDWLVEKATELGAAAIQPLATTRSVLRLDGERGARKRAHWQAIAAAAAEQCGRTRVPPVHAPMALARWLDEAAPGLRGWVLCLPGADRETVGAAGATEPFGQGGGVRTQPGLPPPTAATSCEGTALALLSGPEGGLTDEEQQRARRHGLHPWSLGPRVLRAETAPLAALARLTAKAPDPLA